MAYFKKVILNLSLLFMLLFSIKLATARHFWNRKAHGSFRYVTDDLAHGHNYAPGHG
ncbi:hypothetical protein MtrunA17_Chr3g0101921 [Medicago truncatula]|uniref:Transmembrane protein n=1 Tax=Medicago truncatula TaxID=3880 RepID=A0A396IPV7_MEDTR|nr:hypothetical protein MtrunA17_Chr3g0101921 [Medicago truncatula]